MIFISWSEDLGVETNWKIFSEYWADFCYPSSDDITVMPTTGRWRLMYYHWDQFDYVK